jgi:hypothetical protein
VAIAVPQIAVGECRRDGSCKEVMTNDCGSSQPRGTNGGQPAGPKYPEDHQHRRGPPSCPLRGTVNVDSARDVSELGQGARYGIELRIEPLVTIADIRHEPSGKIAATLREWAALLEQAAASLER